MALVIGAKSRDKGYDVGRTASSISSKLPQWGGKYEIKYFMSEPAVNVTVPSAGTVILSTTATSAQSAAFGITQGPFQESRIGRLINVREVCLTGVLWTESKTAPTTGCVMVRVIVGIDRQHNSNSQPITPSGTAGGGVLETPFWTSELNLESAERFKILADNVYELQSMGICENESLSTVICDYNKSFNMKLPVEYRDELNSALVNTNDFFVLVISDQNNIANCLLEARVRYTDEC